jgi:glycosyltransferase involved in cell wall biosynthesis
MNGEAVSLLGPHGVYSSAKIVFDNVAKKFGLVRKDLVPSLETIKPLYCSKTKLIWYMPVKQEKRNLYLVNSPIFALEAWEMKLRNVPFIICEESLLKSGIKKTIVSSLLKIFKNVPFICLTKKTHLFLDGLGIDALLLPPATKKRRGHDRRKFLLFVGRAEESKNPMFFIRLAEIMKNEKFVLIGKGRLEESIKQKCNGIDNIEYIPFLDDKEKLFDYFGKAKIVIHPAKTDPIGLVVIEALSTSTPVLSSFGTGASDYLPDEWVMGNFNEKEWVEKIEKMIKEQGKNSALAGEIFEKGHHDIDDPYLKNMANELEKRLKRRWPHLRSSEL